MASVNCPKCGTSNDAQGIFCGSCGYALQATGAATFYPPQGQQRGTQLPPPPPPYPGGNMPSSPPYPAAGTPPPYPGGNMSSSPVYPAAGAPQSYPGGNISSSPIYPAAGAPPSYPGGNMSSSPVYPAAGAPQSYSAGNMSSSPVYPAAGGPPPFPAGNMSSSPTYPAAGGPPSYPAGGNMSSAPTYPPSAGPTGEPNKPTPPRRRGKMGIIAILLVVIILIGGALAGIYEYTLHNKSVANTPTINTTATAAAANSANANATATAAAANLANANATATSAASTSGATATPATTATSVATTPGATATTAAGPGDYSAVQPGPGCDANGGTWTPQGFSKITCGTTLSIASADARGYLYLQLPSNKAFSANNTISITGGNLQNYGDSVGNCVGLAEQDASKGFLVEYCEGGRWYIYSISSVGAIVQTLAKNITSTRASEQLSLTLKGTTLSFAIDSEVHTVTISALQPTKVAVTYFAGYSGENGSVTNFSYTVQ